MSEVKGKMIYCSRCGTTHFLKLIGKGLADSGYTIWDKFEPTPEYWMHVYELGGYLCPTCSYKFKYLVKSFMGDKPLATAWRLPEEQQ